MMMMHHGDEKNERAKDKNGDVDNKPHNKTKLQKKDCLSSFVSHIAPLVWLAAAH